MDVESLEQVLDETTAAVIIQSPNFFGVVENAKQIAEMAHAKGALLVFVFTEAVSLGLLEPPRDADIVAGELQSFAIAPSYGGPFAGIIACKEKYVRQLPGRLVGETKDANGNRAFCLTLATREQHIRREKATSNICTNQALIALMATVFMALYGKQGLRELAGAESGQGALPGREVVAALQRAVLQRIRGGHRRAISRGDQPPSAGFSNRRRAAARSFLSRASEQCAPVLHGDVTARRYGRGRGGVRSIAERFKQ